MSHLINQSAAHKLAKTLKIRLGTTGISELNKRIDEIIREAAVKALTDKRKTIIDRDVAHKPDLFS
jgi:hypothetical protein